MQGYVHVPMMYEEDLFIRQNLFAAEYKPSQVSPKLQLALNLVGNNKPWTTWLNLWVEEDLFIRQNLSAAEYKPSQVSPKLYSWL